MYGSDLIDMLGIYVDPANPEKLARLIRLEILNQAARTFQGKVNKHVLTAFEATDTDIPLDASGRFNVASLQNTIWEAQGGIRRINWSNTGYPLWLISAEEEKLLQRLYPSQVFGVDNSKVRFTGTYVQVVNNTKTLTDVATGSLVAGEIYNNIGYTSVVYNGSTYTDGEAFTCVAGTLTYTATGTGKVVNQDDLDFVDVIYRKKPAAIVDDITTVLDYTDAMQDCILFIACSGLNDKKAAEAPGKIAAINHAYRPTETNETGDNPLEGLGNGREVVFTKLQNNPITMI